MTELIWDGKYDKATGKKIAPARIVLPFQTVETINSQYQPVVAHYTRHERDLWILQEVNGLSGILRLPSIGCELPLAEIYERIEFVPEVMVLE